MQKQPEVKKIFVHIAVSVKRVCNDYSKNGNILSCREVGGTPPGSLAEQFSQLNTTERCGVLRLTTSGLICPWGGLQPR